MNAKNTKKKFIELCISSLLQLVGLVLIVYSLGWVAGLGVFMLLFGYGIQMKYNMAERLEAVLLALLSRPK